MKRFLVPVSAVILLFAIGGIDYLSGSEIGCSVFYFVPIALLAWRYAFRWPSILMAAACAVTWYVSDDLGGRFYSSPLIGLWNASLRLLSFLIIACLVSTVAAARRRQQQTNAQLQAAIDELEASARKVKELQSQIQNVCAWTNRIQHEGEWVKFEEFLTKNLQLKFSHGISKEAYAELIPKAAPPPPVV